MSNTLKIIGMDPSMSNWGFAKATLNLDTMEFHVDDLVLTCTMPERDKKLKKAVRKNSEDLSRAKILHKAIQEHTQGHWLAIAEVPHGSQSARGMASYAMCIGILASCPIPLIEVTEGEVKLAGYGKKTATKEEMIEWAMKTHPEAPWRLQTSASKGKVGKGGHIVGAYKAGDPKAENEHLADAVAAIHAGLDTDQFHQAISLIKGSPTMRGIVFS